LARLDRIIAARVLLTDIAQTSDQDPLEKGMRPRTTAPLPPVAESQGMERNRAVRGRLVHHLRKDRFCRRIPGAR
jgi:hypothetical protein